MKEVKVCIDGVLSVHHVPESYDELSRVQLLTVCSSLGGALTESALYASLTGICKEAWEEMKEKAHTVWMELQGISNRLDYTDYSDPEFKSLDEKCESLRAEYDKLHSSVNELFEKYRNEQKALAGLYYFDMEYLYVLTSRLSEIARCIISDIADFREGGEA